MSSCSGHNMTVRHVCLFAGSVFDVFRGVEHSQSVAGLLGTLPI